MNYLAKDTVQFIATNKDMRAPAVGDLITPGTYILSEIVFNVGHFNVQCHLFNVSNLERILYALCLIFNFATF